MDHRIDLQGNKPERVSFDNDDEMIGLDRLFTTNYRGRAFGVELARAQTLELVRVLPMSAASCLITAVLTAASLWQRVPAFEVALWFGAVLLYAIGRFTRAKYLLDHRDRLNAIAAQPARMALGSALAAMIFLVPGLYWSWGGDEHVGLVMCIVMMGMICGGSMTLSSVPAASMAYVWTLNAGVMGIYVMIG